MAQANLPCSEKEEASWHTLECPPLWDAAGNVHGGSFQAYYKRIPDVLTRRGPHNQTSDMHKYARANPGTAFYFMPEKRFPQAARKAAESYPGDKTSVTELACWLTEAIEGPPIQDRDEVAKLLIYGKGSMKLRRFLHLTSDAVGPPSPSTAMNEMSLDAPNSAENSDGWEQVVEMDQVADSDGDDGAEGTEGVEEEHDDEFKAKIQAALAERKRGIEKCLEEYSEAEKVARREEQERKDAAAEEAEEQAFFDGLRNKFADTALQRSATPLLDHLQRAGVHKTHEILADHVICSPRADWNARLKITVVLLAKDHGRHEDALIKCTTEEDWLDGFGQCRTFFDWWKRPDGEPSQPNVYAFFPERPPWSLVSHFEKDGNCIGVVWPDSVDHRMHLYRGM